MDLALSLGPHAFFIVASYALVGGVVVILVGWIIADHRRQIRTLRALEASGITRRSAPGKDTP